MNKLINLSYNDIVNPPMRKCSRCNESRIIYDFKIDRKGNFSSYCKQCVAEEKKKKKELIISNKKERLRNSTRVRSLMNIVNGTNVVNNFINADLTGICAMCGEILLFGEFHHIFGEGIGLTVMLCIECHDRSNIRNINNHCISIGRRIEWGALCYY